MKYKVTINEKELFVEPFFKDKTIYYIEPNEAKTVMLIDLENEILKRDNNELYLELDFKKEKGLLELKEENKTFDLPFETIYLKSNNDGFEIKYKINDKEVIYKMEKVI